jgi:hypothetical protein
VRPIITPTNIEEIKQNLRSGDKLIVSEVKLSLKKVSKKKKSEESGSN